MLQNILPVVCHDGDYGVMNKKIPDPEFLSRCEMVPSYAVVTWCPPMLQNVLCYKILYLLFVMMVIVALKIKNPSARIPVPLGDGAHLCYKISYLLFVMMVIMAL
jgi:hypothetical protein